MPVINAEKGGADANAYADVNEAGDYLDDIYGAEEWIQLEEDDKERLLIMASKMIDRLSIAYEKASDPQALKFPITDPSDGANDGWDAVQEACILQAFFLLNNLDAIREAQNTAIQGVKTESLSSVSKSTTGFNFMRRWDPDALKLLASYINLEFKTYRG
jgi:hypothetical protein